MKVAFVLLLVACVVGAHAHQHPQAVVDAVQNRQLLALSWGDYLSPLLNTLVSSYSKAALEGRAAAVRDFMVRQGVLGNTTQPMMRRLLPQLLQQMQTNRASTAAAPSAATSNTVTASQGPAGQPLAVAQPNVQIVQLPDAAPTSGINVRTRTPVEVGSPVRVRTPTEEYVLDGRKH